MYMTRWYKLHVVNTMARWLWGLDNFPEKCLTNISGKNISKRVYKKKYFDFVTQRYFEEYNTKPSDYCYFVIKTDFFLTRPKKKKSFEFIIISLFYFLSISWKKNFVLGVYIFFIIQNLPITIPSSHKSVNLDLSV